MQNVPAYKGPELFIRWDCREPDVRFKFGMPGSDTPFPYTIQYYIVGYIRPWSEYEIRCLPPPFTPVLVYRTYDGREVHGVYLTEVGELGSMPLHLVSRDIPYLGAPFGGSPFGEDPFSSYSTLARDPNVYDSSNSSLSTSRQRGFTTTISAPTTVLAALNTQSTWLTGIKGSTSKTPTGSSMKS